MNASIARVTAAFPGVRYAGVKAMSLPRVSKSYLLTTCLHRAQKNFADRTKDPTATNILPNVYVIAIQENVNGDGPNHGWRGIYWFAPRG